jgi:hypothetical protein
MQGSMTLVVHVNSADIVANLIQIKADYEETTEKRLQLTFAGGAEAHLIAGEIAEAGVSVIVMRPRPYPGTWDRSRSSIVGCLLAPVPVASQDEISAYLDRPCPQTIL